MPFGSQVGTRPPGASWIFQWRLSETLIRRRRPPRIARPQPGGDTARIRGASRRMARRRVPAAPPFGLPEGGAILSAGIVRAELGSAASRSGRSSTGMTRSSPIGTIRAGCPIAAKTLAIPAARALSPSVFMADRRPLERAQAGQRLHQPGTAPFDRLIAGSAGACSRDDAGLPRRPPGKRRGTAPDTRAGSARTCLRTGANASAEATVPAAARRAAGACAMARPCRTPHRAMRAFLVPPLRAHRQDLGGEAVRVLAVLLHAAVG